jgi:DUF1680 family protein
MVRGWLPPYPETTGYIIPTFLEYAERQGNDKYVERAVRMGDWETEIQLPTGAVRGGMGINDYPVIFNTGQVLQGWTALYRRTALQKYLDSAIRAGDWLTAVQDSDGKWVKHAYHGVPTTYHSRVAWPLLELAQASGSSKYAKAAERHILWTLAQVQSDGWIENMGFELGRAPWTHTIAYTLEGIAECAVYLCGDVQKQCMDAVTMAMTRLMEKYELGKDNPYGMPRYLPARFGPSWQPEADYSCLTGDAQISLIWLRLYQRTGDMRLLNAALKMIEQLKTRQNLTSRNAGIRGALPGSYPVWGKYHPFEYVNWAAKFFADALMTQQSSLAQLEGAA